MFNHSKDMPKVNQDILNQLIASFDAEQKEIVSIVLKKDGSVRASKPKITNDVSAKAAYVWRMVAFAVSTKRQHQCMPMCADFDLPARDETGQWKCGLAREMAKSLRVVEDAITNSIKKSEWHGINRWGKALGF